MISKHEDVAAAEPKGQEEIAGLDTESLWRLADRSQARRDSYGSRANILIAAAGLIGSGLVVSFDDAYLQSSLLLKALFAGSLSSAFLSVILAMAASFGVSPFQRSSQRAGLEDEGRPLVSPRDTFKRSSSFEDFRLLIQGVDLREVLEKELFVSLLLQRRRYLLLRTSTVVLALSVLLFVALALSRVFS